MNREEKYKGFKLISLEFKNDPIFGNLTYNFIDKNDSQEIIYTTIIIGPNGTRKSYLMRRIIELFWDLQILKDGGVEKRYPFLFSMKYSMHNTVYEFTNFSEVNELFNQVFFKINGEIIYYEDTLNDIDFKKVTLPDTIVANSIMVNDKYPFPDEYSFPRYRYLGSRYRPQLASTSTFITRAVESIANGTDNLEFIKGVNQIIDDFFETNRSPYIVYYTNKAPLFFSGNLTIYNFIGHFEKMKETYDNSTTSPPFKLNHYLNHFQDKNEEIKSIVTFCNSLAESFRMRRYPRSSRRSLLYQINNDIDLKQLNNDITNLKHLRSLGILSTPTIEFLSKKEENKAIEWEGYSIHESSSGEHNLFGSLVGMLASVNKYSLIFIDEPEISLHPNWQMKYLHFLRKLFSNPIHSNSHIVVATHSHFLVSDSPGDNSTIIALKKEKDCISIIPYQENLNTYGWSAEEVLYSVFNVRSTRNSFFEYDLTKLVTMLNRNSTDFKEIDRLISKFSTIKLSEYDPLNIIIEKASKYLNSNA